MQTMKDIVDKLQILTGEHFYEYDRTMCLSRAATNNEFHSLGLKRIHSYPIKTDCSDVVGFLHYLQKRCYLMDKVENFRTWCIFENRNDDSIKALDEYKTWLRHVQEIKRFFGDHYFDFMVAV